MSESVLLHLFCGKMAAGKSTLARQLAGQLDALLFVEDSLLTQLYPGEIIDLAAYVRCSTRVKASLAGQIVWLLQHDIPVVLDFPGNTINQRRWFRELIEQSGASHCLHFIDVDDARCKRQLAERSKQLPAGSNFTTEQEFDLITTYFQPPSADEGFNLLRHAAHETNHL